jgi:hypothetical protein
VAALITIEFSDEDKAALNYERYNHPHPFVQRKIEPKIRDEIWVDGILRGCSRFTAPFCVAQRAKSPFLALFQEVWRAFLTSLRPFVRGFAAALQTSA